MPVIALSVKRLRELLGRETPLDELVEAITLLGADVEATDGKTINVEFFPDRPDLLSIEGTARALRAFMGIKPGINSYDIKEPGPSLIVDKTIIPIRGHIECLDVRNVKLDDELLVELMELQEDLHWALGRDRKKVAIGVHDSSRISPPYVYRGAGPDEISFIPLSMSGFNMSLGDILKKHPKGIEYKHIIEGFDKFPIILDSNDSVLSMPPIINGELTKLTVDTREIFVEMTGTERKAVKKAMNILASVFAENGWELSRVKIHYPDYEVITPDLNPDKRTISTGYINRMLGLDLKVDEVISCLEKTGYNAEKLVNGDLSVSIPPYRADILHDIDIVEDVAIGYGYENFKPDLPPLSTTGSRLKEEILANKARQSLIGLGVTEALTLMLTNEEQNNTRMGSMEPAVVVKNPISEEHTIIRTHLLPRLLEVLEINRHHELPQRIFELGNVLLIDNSAETGTRKEKRLAAVIIHHKANFSEGRSLVGAFLRDLSIDEGIKAMDHPGFIEGRCARIGDIGFMGEIHPRSLSGFNLEFPAFGFEMILQ